MFRPRNTDTTFKGHQNAKNLNWIVKLVPADLLRKRVFYATCSLVKEGLNQWLLDSHLRDVYTGTEGYNWVDSNWLRIPTNQLNDVSFLSQTSMSLSSEQPPPSTALPPASQTQVFQPVSKAPHSSGINVNAAPFQSMQTVRPLWRHSHLFSQNDESCYQMRLLLKHLLCKISWIWISILWCKF